MRVLISGGGIAGLTLAYWLHQYNITSVVIEQAQAMRREGHGLDFLGTGYDVASRMGLIDRLAARQIPFEAVVYVNRDGKQITKLDAALMRSITDGKYLGLMHATLEEVLYEALEGTVEVRFGRWITTIEAGPDVVEVTFNDGTSESFDLLIGADGVHSRTRALVFGPEEQFSRSLGYTIACYRLSDRYGIGRTYKLYNEPGRQVVAGIEVAWPWWAMPAIAPRCSLGRGLPWRWEGPICWPKRCTKALITSRRSSATKSSCMPLSKRSKRAGAVLPNPSCLAVPWVYSSNKR